MERVNRIINHPKHKECLENICRLEKDREFCGHTMEHFLDVARLMYIFALEEGIEVDREVVYGAALLHDIGRHLQYEKEIEHHKASADIAEVILPECGFSSDEQQMIIEAILAHREPVEKTGFCQLLYRADKMSRNCFACAAYTACNWPIDKKNMQIHY